MNYFDQLLESYSRLKKRNLILIEADNPASGKKAPEKSEKAKANEKAADQDPAEALKLLKADFGAAQEGLDDGAKSARQKAEAPYFWKAPVKSSSKLGKVLVKPNTEVPIVVKAFYKEHTSMGETVEQLKQFYPQYYQELINYYMEGASSDVLASIEGASLVDLQNIPGKKLRDKVIELVGDAHAEMGDPIRRIQQSMSKLLDQAASISVMAKGRGEKSSFAGWMEVPEKRHAETGEVYQAGSAGYTTPNAWKRFITGDSGQSISRILREGATARLDPNVGLDFVEIARDPDFIARGLEAITALADLAEPEAPPDLEAKCANIPNKVMRRGKKLVFLTGPGTSDQIEGLVMPENDFLAFAVKQAEERCGKKIEEVPRKYTANELNAVRGPAFETGIVGSTVLASLLGEGDEKLKTEVYDDLVDWMSAELFKDSKKFSASMVSLRRFRDLEAAEDVQGADLGDLFESFNAKFGSTPEKFEAFMQLVSKLREVQEGVLKMGSDMAFPVAKEKGVGYSDDVINLYRDPEKAKKGMAKLGLEGDAPEEVTLGELKQKDKVLAALYAKRFKLTDDSQTIYVVGEGVKSYFNPTEVKVGEVGKLQRRSDVIMRAGTVPDDEVEEYKPGTVQRIWKRLWGNDKDDQQQGLESARRYQKDTLDHILESVNSVLPSDMTVYKDDKGNIVDINYDTFTSIISEKISGLTFNSKTKLTLQNIFKEGDIVRNLSDKTTRLKVREEITRLLMNTMQYSDATYTGSDADKLQTRLDARNNLAYTMQVFGGVKDDSSITVMGLDNKSILVSSHMKVVNKYTKGILNEDAGENTPVIKLGGDGFSLKIVDPTNPKRSLSQRTTRDGMTQEEAKTGTSVIASRGAVEEFSVVNDSLGEEEAADPGNKEESLMVTFLRGQAKLLETILATQ